MNCPKIHIPGRHTRTRNEFDKLFDPFFFPYSECIYHFTILEFEIYNWLGGLDETRLSTPSPTMVLHCKGLQFVHIHIDLYIRKLPGYYQGEAASNFLFIVICDPYLRDFPQNGIKEYDPHAVYDGASPIIRGMTAQYEDNLNPINISRNHDSQARYNSK